MSESLTLVKERFMKKVDTTPTSGCWLYTGGLNRGYGHYCSTHCMDLFRTCRAHRISYFLDLAVSGGDYKSVLDKMILHTCDNKHCVNPAHLEVGIKPEPVDSPMPRKYFTETEITEIQEKRKLGSTIADLMDEYSRNYSAIRRVCSGIKVSLPKGQQREMTEKEKDTILQLFSEDVLVVDIARETGWSTSAVWRVIRKHK